MHLRDKITVDTGLSFDRVYVKYHRPENSDNNGRTYVVLWKDDTRYVGISECSRKDQFSKKKGRLIALNRALYLAKNEDQIEVANKEAYGRFFFTLDVNDIDDVNWSDKCFSEVPQNFYYREATV